MTTEDFCGLWARPVRCHSAHVTGITHIHAAALKHGVYRPIWNIIPAGFEHPQAQDAKWSLMSLVLIPPSWRWPPWPPGTLLCCPEGPQALFWKAAPACTAIWGYPIPGTGLWHFDQPAGVPLKSSPVLQPVSHPSSLVSSREGSGSLYCLPIHPSTHFKRKKVPPLLLSVFLWSLIDPIQMGLLQSEIRKYVWQRQITVRLHWWSSEKRIEEEDSFSILVFYAHTDNAGFLFTFKVHKFSPVLFAGNKP